LLGIIGSTINDLLEMYMNSSEFFDNMEAKEAIMRVEKLKKQCQRKSSTKLLPH
jgi:hypothetical protein